MSRTSKPWYELPTWKRQIPSFQTWKAVSYGNAEAITELMQCIAELQDQINLLHQRIWQLEQERKEEEHVRSQASIRRRSSTML